jgi:hypothetical protein
MPRFSPLRQLALVLLVAALLVYCAPHASAQLVVAPVPWTVFRPPVVVAAPVMVTPTVTPVTTFFTPSVPVATTTVAASPCCQPVTEVTEVPTLAPATQVVAASPVVMPTTVVAASPVVSTTTFVSPVVPTVSYVQSPVVVLRPRFFVPGQPVRNFFRAVTP